MHGYRKFKFVKMKGHTIFQREIKQNSKSKLSISLEPLDQFQQNNLGNRGCIFIQKMVMPFFQGNLFSKYEMGDIMTFK